ncbi:MAG: pyruvate kinase [Desulfobacterota bacterium]|nr:pyruvate kinase [Thermodesulfobacteriota bacterium]
MKPTSTKIVATVGPACAQPDMIVQLIRAGVDVFRLNFSHGDHEAHGRAIAAIRAAAAQGARPIAILQDLQGPRIRTGLLKGHAPIQLEQGAEIILRSGNCVGDATCIAVNYDRLAAELKPDDRVLIADGLIELRVIGCSGADVRCRVITGGMLGEHKGINLPSAKLSISSPTEKDLDDLRFGVAQGVDYVALSFVDKAEDIRKLKQALHECGPAGRGVRVIAKIERPRAVDNLDEILSVADGVMVARGDLGIEMSTEAVPAVQKKIIRAANRLAIPVITATQMLESMIGSPRPTRAEASDVANAILDGTDAVMLSGETSVGAYPVEAVATMERIARTVESMLAEEVRTPPPEAAHDHVPQIVLARAACMIARELNADAIAAFTMTGSTARYLSQRRPQTPIYALTPDPQTYRHLALFWGVHAVMLGDFSSTDHMIEMGGRRLRELGLASPGATVVYIAGSATKTPGGTDMIKIESFPL